MSGPPYLVISVVGLLGIPVERVQILHQELVRP